MTGQFIRFVVRQNDIDSGRRQGLFQAMADLQREGTLAEYEAEQYRALLDWFRLNLRKPDSFSRGGKPHAKQVALSWFKDSAVQHVRSMRAMGQILQAHEIEVHVLRTERPGYVVYEDEFQ